MRRLGSTGRTSFKNFAAATRVDESAREAAAKQNSCGRACLLGGEAVKGSGDGGLLVGKKGAKWSAVGVKAASKHLSEIETALISSQVKGSLICHVTLLFAHG